LPKDALLGRFPALPAWEDGSTQPTLNQLQSFAKATYTPVGYLFRETPPDETLPVPDFRTMAYVEVGQASPNLLDTIYQCQRRQDWYRDYARVRREDPLPFVGSLSMNSDATAAASLIRAALAFEPDQRGGSWAEALRMLADEADHAGVLVMVNGVVDSNTHRKLDPEEFRGFALVDELAPVVFVNGADTKAAQIFTLVHELAHIWLGESAVSDVDMMRASTNVVERWCNRVAAEFLIPAQALRGLEINLEDLVSALEQMARRFRVSTLVALRRLYDIGLLTDAQYRAQYPAELERVLGIMAERSGSKSSGNFYNTQPVRASKRLTRALIESTLEGQTLRRDAFRLLGFKKVATFDKLAERMRLA
jgi:Zn-dependent peptidase ImmA (M78 family)